MISWLDDGSVKTVHGRHLTTNDLFLSYRRYVTDNMERRGDQIVPIPSGRAKKKIWYHSVWFSVAYNKYKGAPFHHHDIHDEWRTQLSESRTDVDKKTKRASFPVLDWIDGRHIKWAPMIQTCDRDHADRPDTKKKKVRHIKIRLHPLLVSIMNEL